MRLFVPEGIEAQQLFQMALQSGLQVRHLRASVPSLEDVFTNAIGAGT
jgi:hypothetical protein